MSQRRHVYILTGESGVYVGQTVDVAKRLGAHRATARNPASVDYDAPLYVAMRADGVDTYRLSVVATIDGSGAARCVERETIYRLRAEGRRVFNRFPLVAERETQPAAAAFAKALIQLRDAAGLTQAALAGRAGLSVATIWKWETGLRRPNNIDVIASAARGLGMTLDAFLDAAFTERGAGA